MSRTRHPERGSSFLRFLDRYLGIPVILLLGLFKIQKKQKPDNITNIALVKTSGIGDTIILSGAIKDIRKTYPNGKIYLFCGANNYEISTLIHEVDTVVELNLKNIFETLKTINIVRKYPCFDVLIDFGPWPRVNSLISYFINSEYKIGFRTKNQFRHYIYDCTVNHVDYVTGYHELKNYQNLISHINVNHQSLPKIYVNNVKKERDKVVIHARPGGSRSYLKEWPANHWIELINFLIDNNKKVYLTGGRDDTGYLKNIKRRCSNNHNVIIIAGKYSLKKTAMALKSAELVISVDTGILHLASALNCHLISLHGPTSPDKWGALNKEAISIKGTCKDAPCIYFGYENFCKENKCMQSIAVAQVIEIIKQKNILNQEKHYQKC